MGYATILSGGPDGRYTISLDWGAEDKSQVLAAFGVMLSQLELALGAAEAKVAEMHEREIALQARINDEIATIVSHQTVLIPGSAPPSDANLKLFLDQRRALTMQLYPLRADVSRLKFAIAQTNRDIAYWNNIEVGEVRNAWCTDLTEDREPGSVVATVDIPGDSNLVLLAPGARDWTPDDGYFKSRAVMSPSQAFFNAAILPGWAKFMPTYRWGTITGINYADNTATVALADATLTGQRLNVNQDGALTDVPIVYMTCNASPFEVGSRVVVEFQNQDWDAPRVIGFLDNPKPCNWVCRGADGVRPVFASIIPAVMSSISGTSIDIRGRLNGGAWNSLEYNAGLSTASYNYFESPTEADVGGGFREYSVQIYPVSFDVSPVFPCIATNATPPASAISSSDLSLRNYVEIAIYVSGDIVFNVAFSDGGFAASAQRADGVYVKSPGGLQIGYPNNISEDLVKRLTYTLISEE